MPRKLRLEFPGACYHVINRGNYRADIFASEGAKMAFEACLFEACEKSTWKLHAFVIMTNHYHLALETPDGNLVAGMQWLQATFANRFNRFRGENGHLFQGRYKALPVEDGGPLGQVCHYIDLNPVRAGIVPVEQLSEYRYSSYWYLTQPKLRPTFLVPGTALDEAGGLADTSAGHRSYADFLAWQARDGPAGKNTAYVQLSNGWVLGSADFKKALIKDHSLVAVTRAWESTGAREIREQAWHEKLKELLRRSGRTASDIITDCKGAPWKVEIATALKRQSQAPNFWIAEQLHMGSGAAVSQYVTRFRKSASAAADPIKFS